MLKRQKLYLKLFIMALSLFSTIGLSADTLTYKYNAKDKESLSKMEITKNGTGYAIKQTRGNEMHFFDTDPSYATLKWQIVNPQDDTDISAVRNGGKIIVSGKMKGEQVDKTIKIDGMPWLQEWSIGFTEFIPSGKDKMNFWALDPSSLKRVAEFQMERKKAETIDVNGKKIESVYAWISPASRVIRLMWKGQGMWFRKSDGIFVYENDEYGISQLIEEK